MTFYLKLAISSMKRNYRLYIPYLISCMGMTALYYILRILSLSEYLGDYTRQVLTLGLIVILVFSPFFLNYTNTFLVRRRYREFGLYSILGMDKDKISRVVLTESVMTALMSLVGGSVLGILLGRTAELGLIKVIGSTPNYAFTISVNALLETMGVFLVIHVFLMILSLIKIRRSGPLELMRSEAHGERPPKAKTLLALAGIVILSAAYYLAVSIQTPMEALMIFMFAVLMVIVATYMLFTAGSVTLCRTLQKNKNYYYKKSHFISTSSMAFRMKRNGIGLASICILATMVLVMISSTSSLYFGLDQVVSVRCPMDQNIILYTSDFSKLSHKNVSYVEKELDHILVKEGMETKSTRAFSYATSEGLMNDHTLDLDSSHWDSEDITKMGSLWTTVFITADDYNRVMGTHINLSSKEVIIGTIRREYENKTLKIGDNILSIKKHTDQLMPLEDINYNVTPTMMIILPDYNILSSINSDFFNKCIYYGWDSEASNEQIIDVSNKQTDFLVNNNNIYKATGTHGYQESCMPVLRTSTLNMFGGLFFLGIFLSIAFILATVLIIYYKQIAEGYEDQSRFEIMRKVGMTDKDIKQSINSQMLTVFFAPLLVAAMHLLFAFPFIWRILQCFALQDLRLTIIVTVIAYVLFAIFYTVIYRLTTNTYYRIVSTSI